jgi:hypothetical protein
MSLNVELLEQSFDKIKPSADEFVASFYEKLFTIHRVKTAVRADGSKYKSLEYGSKNK